MKILKKAAVVATLFGAMSTGSAGVAQAENNEAKSCEKDRAFIVTRDDLKKEGFEIKKASCSYDADSNLQYKFSLLTVKDHGDYKKGDKLTAEGGCKPDVKPGKRFCGYEYVRTN